jgi:hypothetical protein
LRARVCVRLRVQLCREWRGGCRGWREWRACRVCAACAPCALVVSVLVCSYCGPVQAMRLLLSYLPTYLPIYRCQCWCRY